MVSRKDKSGDEVPAGTGGHQEFLELCAISTSGSLNEEEQKKLGEHLAMCSECREAMNQFESVVDRAIPALAPELAREDGEEAPSFSQEGAEASFFKRLSEESARERRGVDAEPWLSPLVVRRSRNFRTRFEKYHLWVPLAAGLLLCVTLGILSYRMGKHRGVEIVRLEQGTAPQMPAKPEQGFGIDRDGEDAERAAKDRALAELRREIALQSSENTRLQRLQVEQQLALQKSDGDKRQLEQERDRLAQQVAAGEAALRASEERLNSLQRERSEDGIRSATLEGRVAELSRTLKEQERAMSEQQDLLAKDRDIRELMGARDLYITEVYDVARTGETEKAFGRVFYTKGKSLIFYAYDLSEQPGLREASTFQAWGRRGPDRNQAFNLGMFFEDNVSKKRWVLKVNDKKTLDQIDAVFVTVEPHGGSERPTGKPLLFAYLKVNANHP